MEKVTFGAGCFWCVEACFLGIKGVISVKSGYSGGKVENPTYEEVCKGTTGHAEVVQIEYDASLVNFETLLEMFFFSHDPTQLNRQGNDIGTQYRSVIFYHNENQRDKSLNYISFLESKKIFASPIVTEITPFEIFYKAEDYHQNYFENNPQNQYCQLVVSPKVAKFKSKFIDK